MKTYYKAVGRIRGACKHKHRTILGSERCIHKDQCGCAAQGGYSDRRTVVYANGEKRDMTEAEFDESVFFAEKLNGLR